MALAVERCRAGLGIGADLQIKAQLHKLLLYQPGGFFKVSGEAGQG